MAKSVSDAAELALTEAVVYLKSVGYVCAGWEKSPGTFNWDNALLVKNGKVFRLSIQDVEQ